MVDAQEKKLLERQKIKKLRRKKGKKKQREVDVVDDNDDKTELARFIDANLRKRDSPNRNRDKQLSTIHSQADDDFGSSDSDRDSLGEQSNDQDLDEAEQSQILMGFLRKLDPVRYAAE